jgi:DnaK suppressor protein
MNTDKYKVMLEAEAAKLKADLEELGVQNPDVKKDWVERADDLEAASADLNDVADRTEEYDERRATLATLESRYNDVNRALKQINEGKFGICEVCSGPIEEDRLEVNPSARTCKEHMDVNVTS